MAESRTRPKTLDEHLAQGTFRPGRHAHLLDDSQRPRSVEPHEWAVVRRSLLGGDESKADGLTPDERVAYEHLIADLPPNALARARANPTAAKRMALKMGLNPIDVPPPGRDFRAGTGV